MFKKDQIKKNQKGFTLIDALIALSIISVAFISILTMYGQATKATTSNKIINNALFIAQQTLEDLKRYDGMATITALPSNATDPPPITMDGISYTIQVTPLVVSNPDFPLDNRIRPYQATVSWTDYSVSPATERSIQLTSYYYSN